MPNKMISTEELHNRLKYIFDNVRCAGIDCTNCSAYCDEMSVCIYILLNIDFSLHSRTIKNEDALRYLCKNISRHYCSHNCSRCKLNSPRYGCISRLLTRHFNSLLGCDIHAQPERR